MASVLSVKNRVGPRGRVGAAEVGNTRSTGLEPSRAIREAAQGVEKAARAS